MAVSVIACNSENEISYQYVTYMQYTTVWALLHMNCVMLNRPNNPCYKSLSDHMNTIEFSSFPGST